MHSLQPFTCFEGWAPKHPPQATSPILFPSFSNFLEYPKIPLNWMDVSPKFQWAFSMWLHKLVYVLWWLLNSIKLVEQPSASMTHAPFVRFKEPFIDLADAHSRWFEVLLHDSCYTSGRRVVRSFWIYFVNMDGQIYFYCGCLLFLLHGKVLTTSITLATFNVLLTNHITLFHVICSHISTQCRRRSWNVDCTSA